MIKLITLVLTAIIGIISTSPAGAADGRDFAGYYSLTDVREGNTGVTLTLSLHLFNYTGSDLERASVTVRESIFGRVLATSTLIENWKSRRDIVIRQPLTVLADTYRLWSAHSQPVATVTYTTGEEQRQRPVAPNAMLYLPSGVAADSAGNVYIADSGNCVIRKVDITNTITTVVGHAGSCTYNGTGGLGTSEYLNWPSGVALDNLGSLYIADNGNNKIRKFVISTGYLYDVATIYQLSALAADGQGNIYVADMSDYQIHEINATTGASTVIAGNGTQGYAGDGGLATQAEISRVYNLVVDTAGTTITLADEGNAVIRQFTIGGKIATIAGNGGLGSCGAEGGPAVGFCFGDPMGVAVMNSGSIYVADRAKGYIQSFTVGGNINIVAGLGNNGQLPPVFNDVAPTNTLVNQPLGVLEDPSGNVYFSDSYYYMVRELVASADLVEFFAGTGVSGYSGDGGPALYAELRFPVGLAMDSARNIYVADSANCLVRMVNPQGEISTFAGTYIGFPSSCFYGGDGGPPTSAHLFSPNGLFVDAQDNLYVADSLNNVVRKVSGGIITTIAGNSQRGFSGDGGPAIGATLDEPTAVTEDGAGNIYIADYSNCRIRKIAAGTGIISTVAGNGSCTYTGDGIATENSLYYPHDVKSDANGNLFIADTSNNIVRWLSPNGILTTFGGNSTYGFSGDGGPANQAEFASPTAIFEDPQGNFLVADENNHRIRAIVAFAGLGMSTSSLTFPATTLAISSAPQTITLSGVGPLTINSIRATGPFTQSNNCAASLPNGQTCTVTVFFTPMATGPQTGSLAIQTNAYFYSSSNVTLQGTGTALAISGSLVSFGKQIAGTTSAVRQVKLTNHGKAGIIMGAISLTDTADFAIASNNCPAAGAALTGRASCTIGLTFTPQTTGAKQGVLQIADSDPASPELVNLSGAGTSNVALAPASLTFALQPVGTQSTAMPIRLTNDTGIAITLGNPAVSVTGPFRIASGSSCTNNLSVAPNGSCIIQVRFVPTTAGAATGRLSVTDSDPTSPQTVALTGTGTAIAFSPSALNLGSVTLGSSAQATFTITNVTSSLVMLDGFTLTGGQYFDFIAEGGAPFCYGSLAPKEVCTVAVIFKPSIAAPESSTFQLYDSSAASPQSLPLSGTGVQ